MKTIKDWQGIERPVPVVKGKLHDERKDLSIRLIKQGKTKFAVVYGLQVRENLTYFQAAQEYGLCVFHALACA